MTGRSIAILVLAAASVAGIGAQSPTAPDPWFRASSKPKDFAPARLPWRIFTIELPRSWTLAPASGGVLLTVVDKPKGNQSSASMVLDQTLYPLPFTTDDINDELATSEATLTEKADPAGKNFQKQAKNIGGRRFIVVTYSRPGLNGEDTVVRYAFPNGNVMYRLVCIAPAALLTSKYQETFAHVASSFKPTAPGTN